MNPYNNSIIVPVDTGYGNIKNSLRSFPTGIAAYKDKPVFEGKILHIGDMYYRIGEGHKEYIPDKSSGHRKQQVDIYYCFSVGVSSVSFDSRDFYKKAKTAQSA